MTYYTYYFDQYRVPGWQYHPSAMVDGNTDSHAHTSVSGQLEYIGKSLFTPPSGTGITNVEIRFKGMKDSPGASGGIRYRMSWPGGYGGYYVDNSFLEDYSMWNSYRSLNSDTNRPTPWNWDDINASRCNVYPAIVSGSIHVAQVEIRVTY